MVINFDDVADGTVINTHYSGVTFTPVNAFTGATNIFARAIFGPFSSPNVVTLVPPFSSFVPNSSVLSFFDVRQGIIRATFSSPVSAVNLYANSVEAPEGFSFVDNAYLSAFDSSNNLLRTMSTSAHEVWQQLSISGVGAIAYIEFSSTHTTGHPGVFGLFDNLSYETGNQDGVVPVPEPGTLVLLLGGLAPIGMLRLRKR